MQQVKEYQVENSESSQSFITIFPLFLSTSDLNEESSPTNFIDNKQRTWHPGRLVPVDRSHARDTDRSRGGSRGTASRRRGVYSSSSFPAEVVSELSLHTAAITVPERVFTFNQPEINLRDVWPKTWQDVWHRTRVCLLAGCLYLMLMRGIVQTLIFFSFF